MGSSRTISISQLMATVAMATGASSARAQSLGDFLHDAVSGSPRVAQAAAAAAAAREEVAIARAAGRPSLALDGQVNWTRRPDAVLRADPTARDSNGRIVLGVPLYNGGEVRYGITAARWRARAAEADRRQTVQDVLVETVQAYGGLARDEVVVDLYRAHLAMLGDERRRVQAEIRAAQATRTDLLQTEARLAGAQADLASAEAQRVGSREALRALTGRYPAGRIDPPGASADALVPGALAIGDAAADNADDLIGAGQQLEAARADIGVARSARLPRLSLETSATYGFDVFRDDARLLPLGDPARFSTRGARVALNLRVPLSQGGAVSARVRRSEALAAQAIETRTGTQRLALFRLQRDRARLAANRAGVAVLETAVQRNADAVHGVRVDRRLGFRTTLDVLNAERELLDSRVRLVGLRADLVTGAAMLLRDAGRATELGDDFPRTPTKQVARAVPVGPGPAVLTGTIRAPALLLTSFDLGELPGSRAAGRSRLGYDRTVADLPSDGRSQAPVERLRYQLI